MTTILADSFTASLAKLANDEQKQAKLTAFDLQANPDQPGLQFHRIDKSKDPNFWSVRVNRDLRIIVHKSGGSLMLAYVDHHDDAYKWAERRRIEAHPKTGAIQIVEVRELVEEIASAQPVSVQPMLPLEAPS
ncbi:MAG: DNA helicase, partial [Mesorhizobium sp.]